MDIPKFKKKTKDFLLNEDGKISKQAIVAIGGAVGALAIGSLAAKKAKAGEAQWCDNGKGKMISDGWAGSGGHDKCYGHRNELFTNYTQSVQTLQTTHQHHYNHGSHSSHSSHGSHSSGGTT